MSDSVWDALVETPTLNGLTLKLDQAPDRACRYLDKRRCQKSILQNSAVDWPILLPHDEIKPFTGGSFEDFVYIDAPTPTTFEEMWSLAPVRGPGWYHYTAAQAAIDLGKIDQSQIRWVLKASLRMSKATMSRVVNQALSPFVDNTVRLDDNSEINFQKEACNRMIGLWGRKNHTSILST
jgi:hypothetical protein